MLIFVCKTISGGSIEIPWHEGERFPPALPVGSTLLLLQADGSEMALVVSLLLTYPRGFEIPQGAAPVQESGTTSSRSARRSRSNKKGLL